MYEERQKRVREVCKLLGDAGSYGSLKRTPLGRMRWLTSHRLVMCFNAKVRGGGGAQGSWGAALRGLQDQAEAVRGEGEVR